MRRTFLSAAIAAALVTVGAGGVQAQDAIRNPQGLADAAGFGRTPPAPFDVTPSMARALNRPGAAVIVLPGAPAIVSPIPAHALNAGGSPGHKAAAAIALGVAGTIAGAAIGSHSGDESGAVFGVMIGAPVGAWLGAWLAGR